MKEEFVTGKQYVAKLKDGLGVYEIPAHMHKGLIDFVTRGVKGGSFFSALMSNDLSEAVMKADRWNRESLPDWVRFLHDYVPAECWGSRENYGKWKGLSS